MIRGCVAAAAAFLVAADPVLAQLVDQRSDGSRILTAPRSSPRVVPFQVRTPPGENLYYVKLLAVGGVVPHVTFLVAPGSAFTARVAPGTYQLRYATGLNWSNAAVLFGPGTQTFAAERLLTFRAGSGRIEGVSLVLISQEGGTLSAQEVPRAEF